MPEVFTNVGQITPEWLTQLLNHKVYSNWENGIVVQEVTCTHQTSTWFADIAFLEVNYAGKSPNFAPTHLFLKISKPDLKPADQCYGRKEVVFYNAIASEMDEPPLVDCYDAVYEPETGGSHILLRDLSGTHHQPQHPIPPSKLDCELAVESLANFHAHWWEHPRLGTDFGELFNRENLPDIHLGLPHTREETEKMFSRFVDFLGDRLSKQRRGIFEAYLSSWPFGKLSDRFSKGQGITLIHSDAHAWNFLYPRDPARNKVCIVDWHEWAVNLGTNDLAEMIIAWWYPERRAFLEESLVRRYHQQLTERGLAGYDWDNCWNDYRLSALRILFYPVWMHAENRSPTIWWPILEKSIIAVQELECEELLN